MSASSEIAANIQVKTPQGKLCVLTSKINKSTPVAGFDNTAVHLMPVRHSLTLASRVNKGSKNTTAENSGEKK